MQALLKQRAELTKRLLGWEQKRTAARKKLKFKEAADYTSQIRAIKKQINSIDDRLKQARKAAEVIAKAKTKAVKATAKAKVKKSGSAQKAVEPTLSVLRSAGMVPANEVPADRPVRMAQGIPNAPVTEAQAEAYVEAEEGMPGAPPVEASSGLPAPIVETPWYSRPLFWLLGAATVIGGWFLFQKKGTGTSTATTRSSTSSATTSRPTLNIRPGQTRTGA